MGLCVTFVSGVRRSGKSAVIRAMIDRLWRRPPHYLRLAKRDSDKRPPKPTAQQPEDCGVASARWIAYDDEHIFEILPDALTTIYKRDRFGSVVIEADADPTLRCAYPYDHRVFVMPLPDGVEQVFRTPPRAAQELQRVLDDTASFASEIFGLFREPEADYADPAEDRGEASAAQMRAFLYSPLGDELATRIQLQPAYHGLVESDVIVVNNQVGRNGPETPECLRRVERLLDRIRGATSRRGQLFICDPCDLGNRDARKLLKALKPMCLGGK
jgi:hypothetical protein